MSKKPIQEEDSSIEEVDLTALNITAETFFDSPKKEKEDPTKKPKRVKDEFEEEMEAMQDEPFDDKDLIIPLKLTDDIDFDPDFDEFNDLDDDEEDEDGLPKKRERGLSRLPVDRSLDKRRVGKGLQKFIDVTVPQEFLEGLDDTLQLLFKRKSRMTCDPRRAYGSYATRRRWSW